MFDLEPLEKKVLIFLLAALLLGTGVIIYKKSCPTGSLRIEYSGAKVAAVDRDITNDAVKKVNINTSSADELMSIKGVGKVLALRIADYRSKNGLFVSKDDLKKVPGIGDKLFLKIKDGISLE